MTAELRLSKRVDAIVVGTSAGGVEALSVLLPALPSATQAAVFVVLHLSRDRPSLLAEIFAKRCALPVREAEDKESVAPGTVYFAPSNYHLLLDHGPQMALSADDPVHHSRPSIDVLFESAAEVYRRPAARDNPHRSQRGRRGRSGGSSRWRRHHRGAGTVHGPLAADGALGPEAVPCGPSIATRAHRRAVGNARAGTR